LVSRDNLKPSAGQTAETPLVNKGTEAPGQVAAEGEDDDHAKSD
jgi:hypothetical protein